MLHFNIRDELYQIAMDVHELKIRQQIEGTITGIKV